MNFIFRLAPGFNLVLLDHGLYRALGDRFRTSYCLLWRSLVAGDVDGLAEAVHGMGLPGKRLKKLVQEFPLIAGLTGIRWPWFV